MARGRSRTQHKRHGGMTGGRRGDAPVLVGTLRVQASGKALVETPEGTFTVARGGLREAMGGDCDVLVCDGFTGNIFIKTAEGTALFVSRMVKQLFLKNTKNKIAGLMVRGSLGQFKKKFDYAEIGGTALLGIQKPIVKAHGSSKAYAFRSAIKQLIRFTEAGVVQRVQENIDEMKIDLSDGEENS